ncbi:hypothetical protein D3C87_1181380 [compost metagenome]
MLGRIAADHIDQPRIAAAHHRLHAQQVVGGAIGRIAGELAERPFLDARRRVDHPFQHDLGVRRHGDAITRRPYHLKRRTEQPAGHVALVHAVRQSCRAGQHEQRMGADHHRHRQRLAGRRGALEHAPQVPARMQAGGDLAGRVQHRPVIAGVADAGLGVFGNQDGIGDVGAPVRGEVPDRGNRRQIDLLLHDVRHRAARQHAWRLHAAAARLVLGMDAGRRDSAEHAPHALARGEQVGDQRRGEARHVLEHDGRMAVLRGQCPDQRGRVLVGGHGVAHGQDVVGIRRAVRGQKGVEVLGCVIEPRRRRGRWRGGCG